MPWLNSLLRLTVARPVPPSRPHPSGAQNQCTFVRRSTYGTSVPQTLSPAKPSVVYDTYWRFAVERQEVFFESWREVPFLGLKTQLSRVTNSLMLTEQRTG